MRHIEIEAWALDVVRRVKAGQPVEDDRVELKATFIDPVKAARRLAGHANAQRGSDVLWVIGIDEKKQSVVGADATEFSSWWGAVEACFDQLVPEKQMLAVPTADDVTVVAIVLDTSRIPFVVRNPAYGTPGGGPVEREVPWRDGTAVRSARRSELVELLAIVAREPSLEIRSASVTLWKPHDTNLNKQYQTVLYAEVYVEPASAEVLIIPRHRTSASFAATNGTVYLEVESLHLSPGGEERPMGRLRGRGVTPGIAHTSEIGAEQLLIHGPGPVELEHNHKSDEPWTMYVGDPIVATLRLQAVGMDRALALNIPLTADISPLPKGHENAYGRWVYRPADRA